jgi:hypothetical protein
LHIGVQAVEKAVLREGIVARLADIQRVLGNKQTLGAKVLSSKVHRFDVTEMSTPEKRVYSCLNETLCP